MSPGASQALPQVQLRPCPAAQGVLRLRFQTLRPVLGRRRGPETADSTRAGLSVHTARICDAELWTALRVDPVGFLKVPVPPSASAPDRCVCTGGRWSLRPPFLSAPLFWGGAEPLGCALWAGEVACPGPGALAGLGLASANGSGQGRRATPWALQVRPSGSPLRHGGDRAQERPRSPPGGQAGLCSNKALFKPGRGQRRPPGSSAPTPGQPSRHPIRDWLRNAGGGPPMGTGVARGTATREAPDGLRGAVGAGGT